MHSRKGLENGYWSYKTEIFERRDRERRNGQTLSRDEMMSHESKQRLKVNNKNRNWNDVQYDISVLFLFQWNIYLVSVYIYIYIYL